MKSLQLIWICLPISVAAMTAERSTTMTEARSQYAEATFAGGCFWCMEPPFVQLDGVVSVTPGYTGGTQKDPGYADVCAGFTHHLEAVRIRFDPTRISYEQLLDVFWRNIDPTDSEGQFADQGDQYRTAIFYHDETQHRLAEASKQRTEASGRFDGPIVTEIRPAMPFYPAEDYHQEYYRKNPQRYKMYRRGSGREGFLERLWGKKERE